MQRTTIRATANCSFCGQNFEALAEVGPVLDGVVCDDGDGKLCCGDCLCVTCGRGHITQADRDECEVENRFPNEPGDTWSYQMLRVS